MPRTLQFLYSTMIPFPRVLACCCHHESNSFGISPSIGTQISPLVFEIRIATYLSIRCSKDREYIIFQVPSLADLRRYRAEDPHPSIFSMHSAHANIKAWTTPSATGLGRLSRSVNPEVAKCMGLTQFPSAIIDPCGPELAHIWVRGFNEVKRSCYAHV